MAKRICNYLSALAVLLLVLGLCGCSFLGIQIGNGAGSSASEDQEVPETAPEYPVTAGGAELPERPERIVSLSPSITEKLIDLDAADRLAGVSDSCASLPQVKTTTACGSVLLPDMDAILALGPDVVLSAAELPQAAADALAGAGIPVALFARVESLDELWALYTELAVLLSGNNTGAAHGQAFAAGFREELAGLSDAVRGQEPVPALYLRMLDFTVATGDTLENELMELIGLENIAAAYTGWQFPEDDKAELERIAVIYCDDNWVDIKKLENNTYYTALHAVWYDQFLYVDAGVFERQGHGMVAQLTEMLEYAYPDILPGGEGASQPEAAA